MALLDGCKFLAVAGGTVSFAENSAVLGYNSLARAQAVNGSTYKYHAESADKTQWEDGIGTYTSSTFTLTRDTVYYNSANTGTLQGGAGTKINFTAAPTVAIVLMRSDVMSVAVSDTAPTGISDNSLWFESDTGLLYIRYNDGTSSQWVIVAPPGVAMGAYARFTYTATAGQTVFSGTDDNGNPLSNAATAGTEVDVDGLRLLPSDYTVNSATQITILNPLDVGQKVYITCLGTFSVSDTLSASANGSDIANKSGFRTNIGTFGSVKVQKFTATGTYTPTAGMLHCIIEAVGGGGGGSGMQGATSCVMIGGAGGAGGYSRKYATASDIGASKAVTIGAAGTAGAAGDSIGGTGGDTSVGTLCIAKGGSGGSGGNTTNFGGAGGVAGTGDVASPGAPGGGGLYATVNSINFPSQPGASTLFGAGGSSQNATANAAGRAATGFGSGGAGAVMNNSTSALAGGAGAPGLVIITEYCSQ